MKYTELTNEDLIAQLEEAAQALLLPNNTVNLPHVREMIVEAERRQAEMHATLQEIKAEQIKPKEDAKKRFETVAQFGRLAIMHDIVANGERVAGITLVVGQLEPELPLPESADYKRLVTFLQKWYPPALKVTVDVREFKKWYARQRKADVETLDNEMNSLGITVSEPKHVRFS